MCNYRQPFFVNCKQTNKLTEQLYVARMVTFNFGKYFRRIFIDLTLKEGR